MPSVPYICTTGVSFYLGSLLTVHLLLLKLHPLGVFFLLDQGANGISPGFPHVSHHTFYCHLSLSPSPPLILGTSF